MHMYYVYMYIRSYVYVPNNFACKIDASIPNYQGY